MEKGRSGGTGDELGRGKFRIKRERNGKMFDRK
jgi:hypothetical protein